MGGFLLPLYKEWCIIENMKKRVSVIILILCFLLAGGTVFVTWWKHTTPIKRHPFAKAVLTQNFDATGAQCIFHTWETKEGLVVIDGGSRANSEYVRSVIKAKGGHVNAWIVTHGHPDHVGAFNEIYANPQGIIIDDVYTTDFDLEKYHELCNWWDEPEYYDEFWSLTHTNGEANDDFHTLKRGDLLKSCGLNIEVFSTFSEVGTDYGDDIANLGSMMFKVNAGEVSVLYCSDIHNNRGLYDDIGDKYGDLLKADYLQMGHHGNNSCPASFIDLVSPSYAFFDCPKEFFDNPDYDAKENLEYMENKGVICYSFETAPNEIIIK